VPGTQCTKGKAPPCAPYVTCTGCAGDARGKSTNYVTIFDNAHYRESPESPLAFATRQGALAWRRCTIYIYGQQRGGEVVGVAIVRGACVPFSVGVVRNYKGVYWVYWLAGRRTSDKSLRRVQRLSRRGIGCKAASSPTLLV
jgi:hypothetical protein